MKTKILKEISSIVDALKKGEVVALPTDTIYGVCVMANNEQAIQKMRLAKNRPDEKAFAYVVDSLAKVEVVCELTPRDRHLIETFLPGAVTFIFNKKANDQIVDESLLDTLAIRMVDHPLLMGVLSQLDVGLYLTSANLSGYPSVSSSEEVLQQLEGRIYGIVVGNSLKQSASTIVDCTQPDLKLLRVGPISFEVIEKEDVNER